MPSLFHSSTRNLELNEIYAYFDDSEAALKDYFKTKHGPRFLGYTQAEVDEDLDSRISELELSTSLTILASVEAAFRLDYLTRCRLKKKDPLSKELRRIHKAVKEKAKLEDQILKAWIAYETPANIKFLRQFKESLKLRHWLAHGRYWQPHAHHCFDYPEVSTIASSIFQNLQFFK